jgi:uncharacterized protein (DUF1778 family)
MAGNKSSKKREEETVQVRIRFPKSALDKIRDAAQADERSINQFVVRAAVAAADSSTSSEK